MKTGFDPKNATPRRVQQERFQRQEAFGFCV
jgi:hypothetical protein